MTTATKPNTTESTRTEDEVATAGHDAAAVRSLIALLDSWVEVDKEGVREEKETWEFLKNALDEDGLSYRKLFP